MIQVMVHWDSASSRLVGYKPQLSHRGSQVTKPPKTHKGSNHAVTWSYTTTELFVLTVCTACDHNVASLDPTKVMAIGETTYI